MIIVTFSDREEQVVEKIKAVLAEDQEIECISTADGKEMVFGDVEIRTKQRRVFLSIFLKLYEKSQKQLY